MRIAILNGDMQGGDSDFSVFMETLADRLREHHRVDLLNLQEMNLHYCTGCWSCWWKTPGRCSIKDDAEDIFRSVIHSEFVIFGSPLMAGFISSRLKMITDRLIVLLHPYIQLVNGESHHRKRYEHYPDFGLVIQKEPDTDREDLSILNDIYDRFALNFHCRNRYLKIFGQDKLEDIIDETCSA